MMNGEPARIGLYGSSLRKQLFAEHLGLLNPSHFNSADLTDPISDSFYHDTWIGVSQQNTDIYDEVSGVLLFAL